MSSSTIMDSYDAPMLDYSGDMDVLMHTTISSPRPWAQHEAIMEEDVHPTHVSNPFPSQLPQQDVEVDMDDYYDENVEYEMADGEIAIPDTELVDIDVYDAPREEAFSASASISHPAGLTEQDLTEKLPEAHYTTSDSAVAVDPIPAVPNLEPPFPQSTEPVLLTPTLPQGEIVDERDTTTSDQSDVVVAPRASTPVLKEVVPKDRRSDDDASIPVKESVPASSSVITAGDETCNKSDTYQHLEQKSGREFPAAERELSTKPVPAVALVKENSHQIKIQDGVTHEDAQEGDYPRAVLDGREAGKPERPATESNAADAEDNADPHEISEGVYIEPPPPVLLELPSSDRVEYTLFNVPATLHSDDANSVASSTKSPYMVLFQSRPTLYYETLNDVFEALRQEERIQSMAEFVDGEMIIDAYDLQLIVSEDNVHAREVSLHDLNVLHHGLGLIGPLRLRLRTVFSRFIHCYRDLQEQITRLHLATAASHPTENSNGQVHFDPVYKQDSQDRTAVNDEAEAERESTGDDSHEGTAEGDADEQEEVESTYYGYGGYQDGDPEREEETYEEFEQYTDAREYPPTHEDDAVDDDETAQVVVANDESESVLDADPIREGSTDPDLAEHQAHSELHEEDEVSGDVEVPATIIASHYVKENISSPAEPDAERIVPTEVSGSAPAGELTQFEDSEERQGFSAEPSGSDSDYEDEQAADLFTDNSYAEVDVVGEDSAQSTNPEGNTLSVAAEEEQGASNHNSTDEGSGPQAKLTTPVLSLQGNFSELADPYDRTEEDEDEDNPESWELDDGYAAWEETVEGDDPDTALVGELDSASTGSSTLSGKTASIASKRSFGEVDGSESPMEQSSTQSPKKTRTR